MQRGTLWTSRSSTHASSLEHGPTTMTYRGTARFVDPHQSDHSVSMEAFGKDVRGPGGAIGKQAMHLVEPGETTQGTVQTKYALTGKAAQFGRGVMADVSGKLGKELFIRQLAEEVRNQRANAVEGGGDAEAQPRKEPRRVDSPQKEDTADLLEAIDVSAALRKAPLVVAIVVLLCFLLRRKSGR